MIKRRVPIGRRLNSGLLGGEEQGASAQRYTLASGAEASFRLVRLSAEEVEESTYINPLTNPREQSALTRGSVADICRTLPLQQFFPAIGRRQGTEPIELLDGSRRRAAALFCQVGLEVLVTDASLSLEDARQLAADIQTAREHNLREVGLRLLILRESGLKQKEIAASEGLSEAKVTRALQAAAVPAALLEPFPLRAEISYPDYRALLDLSRRLQEAEEPLSQLIEAAEEALELLEASTPADVAKEAIMRAYRGAAAELLATPQKERAEVEALWSFSDRNSFARRRRRGRQLSFEFNRLPRSLERALESAVRELLERHLEPSSDSEKKRP